MFSDSVDSIPLDFMPQVSDRVALDPVVIDRAVAFSQAMPEPIRWQSYLALLALEGFAAWLETQTLPIQLERSDARLIQPSHFDVPAAITHLTLSQLQVCLIVASADREEAIEVPLSVVDELCQVAHLYVAIAVDDESGQADVQCFIRYDQLAQYRQDTGLLPTIHHTYLLPRAIFDADLHHLLLFATGLRSTAIAQAVPSTTTSPAIQQILLQPIINTATWAQQQLANLAKGLHQLSNEIVLTWVPPERQTASAMRSAQAAATQPVANLAAILQNLRSQGYDVPQAVRAVYQDVLMGDQKLRLSIVTWQLAADSLNEAEQEWSLLVIVEMVQGVTPIEGIRLAIREQQTLMLERILLPGVAYEIAQVIGFLHEQFMITISFPPGSSVTLPPIAFEAQ
ncbi:DUF1822 family protein [Stenomitos frigidus]|uniref:DUF1822 domain-containing protein n=1 Tax=Stenomitos frigidus ULC18 TaxID=2107698 RepID=A0A2T1DWX2_9CYAN|nr:DUF1822 family protein [Stenomitos frigidus]PSB24998.1 hypothetical protein C7B82_24885 [Stenomitos frigidus ULC18]